MAAEPGPEGVNLQQLDQEIARRIQRKLTRHKARQLARASQQLSQPQASAGHQQSAALMR